MTLIQNTAEGGSNGTAITTANTGGTSGRAFDTILKGSGAAIKFDNAQTAHGALSYQFTTGATFVNASVEWTIAPTSSSLAMRMYIRFGVLPLGSTQWWMVNPSAQFATSPSNKFQIWDAVAAKWTSTNTVATGVWYRIEMECQAGTTSSNGYLAGRYFLGDSTTPVETAYSTNAANTNTGTPLSLARFGQTTSAQNGNIWLDDLAINDGTTTPIGPATPAVAAFAGWGIPT